MGSPGAGGDSLLLTDDLHDRGPTKNGEVIVAELMRRHGYGTKEQLFSTEIITEGLNEHMRDLSVAEALRQFIRNGIVSVDLILLHQGKRKPAAHNRA